MSQPAAAPTDETSWWTTPAPQHAIEGYASEPSVFAGDVLELHVSTRPAARYRVELWRLGWAGGEGATEVDRHPRRPPSAQGVAQEVPEPDAVTGRVAASWPVTDAIPVAGTWPPGLYIARLVLISGPHAGGMAFVPFVVRRPLDERPPLLVWLGTNTAQAYNHWGGKSLYPSNSTNGEPAVKASFHRPCNSWRWANENSRFPFSWDYQLVRFLEREGFDAGFVTDVDVHRQPWILEGHPVIVLSGHGEYWTREMRDGLERALGSGSNLACMGANTGYWQTRYEDDGHTMAQYRRRTIDPVEDPGQLTILFRDLTPPRPEAEILGVRYSGGLTARGEPPRDFALHEDALGHPWLNGTGFAPGDRLAGLVGYEWDALDGAAELAELQRFFTYTSELSDADAIAHRLVNGALVFSAGSLQFAWGLDDWGHPGHADPRLQRFMRNALESLVASSRWTTSAGR